MPVAPALAPAVLLLAAAVLVTACREKGPGPAASTAPDCRILSVVDGDTVDMTCTGTGPFRARLTGFDTPESHEPRCRAEADLARAATTRLRALVRDAAAIDAALGDLDRYDRRLVALRLDGRDVGATLIAEGLAVRYTGGRRIDWCARLS